MRISRGRGACLAVAALALGAANGNYVTFTPSDFENSINGRNIAILPVDEIGTRKFSWTTNTSNIVVSAVNFYSSDGETDKLLLEGPKTSSSSAVSPGLNQPNQPNGQTPSTTTRNSIPNNSGGSGGSDISDEPTIGGGSSKGTNGGGGGGLSSGAVIGIAVACGVVGLVLIFALVWFLIRRRQQQHRKPVLPADSSFASGHPGDELMVEKEGGADADAAPHSPYSDDGSPSGSAAAAAGAANPGVSSATYPGHQQPQDAPRSLTPYSDLANNSPTGGGGAAAVSPSIVAASLSQSDETAGVPRVSVPSATPGRATPRGLTTPYAHLVEDGMTEEEIRRLEDEERQLDAAIEQAGRR
ncbi:Kin of IRRE-like protein 3 [Staphylotrichum tortipilum]|uniref:Kin of IRRE-like protein 3 n=1 Tax=Staphylotrichum tortipilum TaxID=2831512 RepID=A0AAN6MNF0_9PEZI|nr:Kin of IRRE-like protein 3 [Staphylotrichum longicolle]